MKTRTLCLNCKSAYEDAGYRVYQIKNQYIKGKCEICSKAGYDYSIKKSVSQGEKMCNHQWKKVGECHVCIRCGITRLPNGQIFFDKKIVNYKSKRR